MGYEKGAKKFHGILKITSLLLLTPSFSENQPNHT